MVASLKTVWLLEDTTDSGGDVQTGADDFLSFLVPALGDVLQQLLAPVGALLEDPGHAAVEPLLRVDIQIGGGDDEYGDGVPVSAYFFRRPTIRPHV